MRVLLVVQRWNYPSPLPSPGIFPQGIAYVAGALKAANHEVAAVNVSYAATRTPPSIHLRNELTAAWHKWRPDVMAIGGQSADYLFIKDAMAFWRAISPDTPIVLGGGIVTADPQFIVELLKPDFAIRDEAEIPIVQLLEALSTNARYENISGLIFRQDGIYKQTAPMQRSKIMPAYSYPDYDPFDIESFFAASNNHHAWHLSGSSLQPRIFPVSAGRSCPYQCTFCFHSANLLYRQRPISEVVAELEYFYEKYRFNVVCVYDELFSIKEARVREFSERIKKSLPGVEWTCAMRVTDVNPDLLRQMKDSGCFMIGYGLESASDTVLASMRKKIKQEDILKAIRMTEETGIIFQGNFIFGDPAETPETIAETMDFYTQYCRDIPVNVGRISPFPGTPIFKGLIDKGIITDKRAYYENIERASSYNMTSMPDDVFNSLYQEQILTKANSKNAVAERIRRLPKNNRPDWELREDVLIDFRCPHCDSAITISYDVYFDPEDIGSWSRIQHEIVHICMNCRKAANILVTPLLQRLQGQEVDEFAHLPPPHLLESRGSFNIVVRGQVYFAIAQRHGPVDMLRNPRELMAELDGGFYWAKEKNKLLSWIESQEKNNS